nr:elongation factor 1-gamma [Quercus suber]
MILHAVKTKKNSYKTLITAEYTSVKVELAPNFEMGVSNKPLEFIKMKRTGKVPVVETPDGPVFESSAIARYGPHTAHFIDLKLDVQYTFLWLYISRSNSVLIKPDQILFQVLVLLAFLALFCCAGDIEARRRVDDDHNDTISLIANQSHLEEESDRISPSRNSEASTKCGSISFRTFERDGTSMGTFVELSIFSPSRDASNPTRISSASWLAYAPSYTSSWTLKASEKPSTW